MRPSSTWMDDAECRKHHGDRFFPDSTGHGARVQIAEAVAVCDECPVAAQCREYAIKAHESGVWGGTYLEGGKVRNIKLPRLHGTPAGFQRHKRRGERPCLDCCAAETKRKTDWARSRRESRAAS